MYNITDKTFAKVYKKLLSSLLIHPDYCCFPRKQQIKELINCSFEITDVNKNLYFNTYRKSPLKYISAEFIWYLMRDLDASFIEQYASLWARIKDDDGKVCSNYGNLLFGKKSQYKWACDSLIKDKDSRQAIIHFNRPYHQKDNNKDFVCTMFGQFFIRDEKLSMGIHMRSNDVIFGLSSDYPFFNVVHQQMYRHLKNYYPSLEMGSYFHNCGSLHLYERHFDLVKNILSEDIVERELPLLDVDFIDIETGMVNEGVLNSVNTFLQEGTLSKSNFLNTLFSYLTT